MTKQGRTEQLTWTRADPSALDGFNPASKTCIMNCGPHTLDPRSDAERKMLCTDCLNTQEKP